MWINSLEKAVLEYSLTICRRRPVSSNAFPIFIVSAPRTGSTVFFLFLVSTLGLKFFSNFINKYFYWAPSLGLLLQSDPVTISLKNKFGKTQGLWQPSEGSYILRRWFGGGHPSQLVSNNFLPGRKKHFIIFFEWYRKFFGSPLVIKNPWNSFRIISIYQAVPWARFVWVVRDIASAALSDLEARYLTKGDPFQWNSATPANFKKLQSCTPPHVQVVENQYEFNRAIYEALSSLPSNTWVKVWYEDFCLDPLGTVWDIAQRLGINTANYKLIELIKLSKSIKRSCREYSVPSSDKERLLSYVKKNYLKFKWLIYSHESKSIIS